MEEQSREPGLNLLRQERFPHLSLVDEEARVSALTWVEDFSLGTAQLQERPLSTTYHLMPFSTHLCYLAESPKVSARLAPV